MPTIFFQPLMTNAVTVESSALLQVAYDGQRQTLQVVFRDGSVYEYSALPLPVYEDLRRASSKGAYFNRNIRDRFPQRIVQGPKR